MKYCRKLFFFFLFFFITSGLHAGIVEDFQSGWKSFHSLQKDKIRSKYRSHWLDAAEKFQRVYSVNPDGSYAPKALYYLGRVYEELGARSYLRSDSFKSLDYFQRVLNRFAFHSWADDAQFHMASVNAFQLKDKQEAIKQLQLLLKNYPKGDMCPDARIFLHKLGGSEKKEKKEIPKKIISPVVIKKQESYSTLLEIRHWSSHDYTRVVLDVDQDVKFQHRLLKPDPKLNTSHRLVVDLEKTHIGKKVQEEEKVVDGILSNIRVGQYQPHQARIVLDIENIQNTRVFSLSDPFRIVVDVFGDTKAESKKITEKKQEKKLSKPIAITPKKKEMAQNIVEQLGLKVGTIMLDAGHGGKDPGANGHNVLEKDINLRMVKILGNLLKKRNYRVVYTRKKDVFIPLEERTALANSGYNVDIFISVHCNAHTKSQAKGFEAYYLNLAKSKDAVRVAARENAVSVKKISDLQFILTDLMLNSKINESRNLAKIVHDKALKHVGRKYKIKSHGVHEAPFYVLMGAKMPAILLELGYLTNKDEAKNLNSDKYLKIMAEGICQGIDAYRKKIERYSAH